MVQANPQVLQVCWSNSQRKCWLSYNIVSNDLLRVFSAAYASGTGKAKPKLDAFDSRPPSWLLTLNQWTHWSGRRKVCTVIPTLLDYIKIKTLGGFWLLKTLIFSCLMYNDSVATSLARRECHSLRRSKSQLKNVKQLNGSVPFSLSLNFWNSDLSLKKKACITLYDQSIRFHIDYKKKKTAGSDGIRESIGVGSVLCVQQERRVGCKLSSRPYAWVRGIELLLSFASQWCICLLIHCGMPSSNERFVTRLWSWILSVSV